MLALRPTFSESWYRVQNLRARLRPSAQISRQFYRGERWYVVRDPAGNQFHRLSDAAYRFIGLLDGTRTVQEAWDLVGGTLADDAPTQPEVIQILSQLHSANLLEADIPADATVLLTRHKMLMKRQMQGRLMNILFPRIPIWDCDRFLKTWLPVARLALSKVGALVWLIVVIAAVAAMVPETSALWRAAGKATDPGNWFYLWLVFVFTKFIHELGHAFACRRFGGEVHEMGIMFLVFIPTPYVDASTAWAFPSKWARMFVGAAGMIVELFFAAIMVFVWLNTSEDTLVNQLACNAILIASVSTVIFNANPLLRYDGYYMLSDYLEIPNLRQKSTEYSLGLIKRHVFRVKQQQPLPPVRQRFWLFSYAILSSIYRVYIGILIIIMVAYTVPVLGILMAIGGVITWLVVPVYKIVKYLALEPELHRKRGRATVFTLATAIAIFIAIGVIPFSVYIHAVGVLEPEDKAMIYAKTPGFITEVRVKDGQYVHQGDVLLVCRDEELEGRIAQVRARLKALDARIRQSAVINLPQKAIDQIEINTLSEQLEEFQTREQDLTIKAPISGWLSCPKLEQFQGIYLQRGVEVAQINDMSKFRVRAVVEQRDAELATHAVDKNPQIRLVSNVERTIKGGDWKVSPAALAELPHTLLGYSGGGEIEIDPSDKSGKKPVVDQFELRVPVDEDSVEGLWPGQRAYVRIKYRDEPLIWQWSRRFWQMVQTQGHNSKWL
jgi:putative peptide zinc metalloprotease protein